MTAFDGLSIRQRAIQNYQQGSNCQTRSLCGTEDRNPDIYYDSVNESSKISYPFLSTRKYALSIRYYGDSEPTKQGDPGNVNTFFSSGEINNFWEESIVPYAVSSVTVYYYDL